MDTIKIDSKSTKMVAHRGVSGLELENTAAAFIAAGNRSYYGVETDVHYTADGCYVAIHDSNTARVEGKEKGTGIVIEDSTMVDIRTKVKLKSRYGCDREDIIIPTLADYIEICKYYGKICVLEIKGEFPKDKLLGMVEVIKSCDYLDGVIFIAFKENNLKVLRELLPTQKLQFLCNELTDEILAMLDEYNFDIDIRHTGLTKEVLDTLHAHGHEVNCWTVDDPARADELVGWGVDQITSNILE